MRDLIGLISKLALRILPHACSIFSKAKFLIWSNSSLVALFLDEITIPSLFVFKEPKYLLLAFGVLKEESNSTHDLAFSFCNPSKDISLSSLGIIFWIKFPIGSLSL